MLVVRLDMKKNREQTYLEMLEQAEPGSKNHTTITAKLDELIDERQRYKHSVIRAMKDHYSFSKYCFIENQNIEQFMNGDETVLEWTLDPEPVNSQNCFYLLKGDRDSHWIISDFKFKALKHPFPSSHDLGVKKFFDFLAGKENFDYENLSKVFSKMQSRLEKFYSKQYK